MSAPRRLRAPEENGAVVSEPPLAETGQLLSANRQLLDGQSVTILNQPWSQFRRRARGAALAAAQSYHREHDEPVPQVNGDYLLLAGHQPELFHPGVWVKNFALSGLARQHGGIAINLVVDNDTAKSMTLRVPQSTGRIHKIPFDQWTGEIPYEERAVLDENLFASMPEHAAPALRDWGFEPMLNAFWQEVNRRGRETRLLGERFAGARRAIERNWGCHNLELPVSRLCRTEPFAEFACHLVAELPRFHQVYNDCVHDHRERYDIHSRNHPVPDLTRDGDWLEVPLWAWRAGQHQRGRLMVRHVGDAIELRVGREAWPSLPPLSKGSADVVQAWQELEARGYKVRSRALTNTLFARLFLGDVFIHGIGGGKYDELTDEIIRRFYGVEPPAFLVLSSTLLLPFESKLATTATCRRLARELRDRIYNPQRYLNGTDPAGHALAEEKQMWIARQPTDPPGRRERFHKLRYLTELLRPRVGDQIRELQGDLDRSVHDLEINSALRRRDYAFCLYPEELLRPFCTQFLKTVTPVAKKRTGILN